ncbi:MAG: GAF domain-containing protein [bacterium]|nr:GAF domain-containing protein [bacterium]
MSSSPETRRRTASVRTRIMRPIAFVVLGIFLILGLSGLFGIQASSRAIIRGAHLTDITLLREQLNDALSDVTTDVRAAANDPVTRRFATTSLASVVGEDVNLAQAALAERLEALVNDHLDTYLAVRYVTFTGAIWTEVTNAGGITRAATRIRPNELNDDPTLVTALGGTSGDVIASDVDFRVNNDAPASTRLIPFVRFASPVFTETSTTDIAGVIQIDFAIPQVISQINATGAAVIAAQEGRRLLVVDDEGRILADSGQPNTNFLRNIANRVPVVFDQAYPVLAAAVENIETVDLAESDDLIYTVDQLDFSSGAQRFWRLILVDERGTAAAYQVYLGLGVLVLFIGFGGVVAVLIDSVVSRNLRPLRDVADLTQTIGRSYTDSREPLETGDEFGQLIEAFESMASEQFRLRDELEAQRGRFTRNLDIAARIGRETLSLREGDTLINRAINLICDEFGYYHAQLFRIDDAGLNAVLVVSRGVIGQELLARGYRVPINDASVIGTVAAHGQPILIPDATLKAGDQADEAEGLLAETRSQMAVPLLSGGEVIGVLDVQSQNVNDFREEDLRMVQILADQIAVALENARLLKETSERLTEIDSLNRQLSSGQQQAETLNTQIDSVYRYDLLTVKRGGDTGPLSSDQPSMTIPISIRGEVIGALEAAAPQGIDFTAGDEAIMRAVADRVGIALENARLFELQQSSLQETSRLYELVRALNEANSLEDVLHSIVMSVIPDAVSVQIGVFDEYADSTGPLWMEILAEWTSQQETQRDVRMMGIQLHVPDHPLLAAMQPNQITLVNDTERDTRLDDVLRAIIATTGGRSMVLIPVTVRGTWRGVMMAHFPEPRTFGLEEGRVYNALIDQAGVVIDNRMLLRSNEITLKQVERLYSASRAINMAQTAQDLVRAAVGGNDNLYRDYELVMFEGDIDASGWPTRIRLAAYSEGTDVQASSDVYDVVIATDSPLRYREPQIITPQGEIDDDDTPHANNLTQYVRQRGNRFAAVFPLFSANQPIALFLVTSKEAREEISSEDFDVYRALTGQMSTVLQNRRLLDQTAASLDETRRLYAASRAIATAPDKETVYEIAARYLNMTNAAQTRLSVLLTPSQSADAPFVEYTHLFTRGTAYTSDIDVGTRIPSSLVPFGELTRQARTQAFNRSSELAVQPALHALMQRSGSLSAAIISIQSRQRWFGVIFCESDKPAAFDDAYLRFAQAVGDQVAIAVESLSLFSEAQQQAQRALALAEAGQLANQIGAQFEKSIGEVFRRVAEPAAYDRWILMLHSPGQHGLRRVAEYNVDTGLIDSDAPGSLMPLNVVGVPLLDAFRLGRTLLVNDPSSYPNFPRNYAGLDDFGDYIGKHVAVPVFSGSQTIGALAVGRRLDALDLDESDEQLARTLAAQVGIAVENRRLFVEAESERSNLRSILETLPAGVLVLDARTFTPVQFNQQAVELLGRSISISRPFDIGEYNVYRASSRQPFANDELPIFESARSGRLASSDDVMVMLEDGSANYLLVNAAPIVDAGGSTTAIAAAFQDISRLRGLETTLQETLNETMALYDTTRALAAGTTLEALLDQIINRLGTLQPAPDNAFVLLLEPEGLRVARALTTPTDGYSLPDELLTPDVTMFIPDVADDLSLDDAVRLALLKQNIRAVASLPMLTRSRAQAPLGWLVVVYQQAQESLIERAGFLGNLADNAAVAIDNRNLFRDTQAALQEANNLYRATTTISRVSGTEQLSEALRSTIESLKPDVMAAYLFVDEQGSPFVTELFNENQDGAPLDFAMLIERHGLGQVNALFINDLRAITDPNPLEMALQSVGTIRALGLIQMRSKTLPAGCLIVGYHRPRTFDESIARYLSAISDSASVIIDNILLFGQIQNTLEETSTLYQASRALSDAANPVDILDVVTAHLHSHTRTISTAFVAMLVTRSWESPNAMVRVAASWRNPAEADEIVDLAGITLTEEQFPAWKLLAVNDVYTIDDVLSNTQLDIMEQAGIESIGVRSVAFLPLRVSGQSIGTLVIGSRQPYTYTDRDLRIYRSFSEQASLRLEATRLLEQTQRRARQLATSAEVSSYASSLLDLQFLLPRIVDLIKDQFRYDHVQIFMMDDADEFAELRASTGEPGRQLLGIKHRLAKGSSSVIGQVTLTGQPTIAADTADASVIHRPNPYLPNTRSEMAIPLMLKGRIVGALDVQSNQPNAFDEDDISVLRTLAAQISVAIDNAELYEDAQRRASETSFLFNVTSRAAAAESLDEALANVADEMLSELDASATVIYLPRQYIEGDDETSVFTQLDPVALAGNEPSNGGQPLSEINSVRLDDGSSLLAQAGAARRSFILGDLEQDRRYLPINAESRSAIIVPLVTGAQLVGLVVVESLLLEAYDDNVLRTMFTLAGSLSAIVQNQQLLEQVQRQNDALRELDRLKSDFLANMSHELRTPLNSIIGFSRVILKGIDGPLTEMQEQDLSTIYNSGLHLLNLINDILDQAKIAAGKMDLQFDYFEMKTVIDGVRSIGIGLVKEKPIDIQVHLAPGLPKAFGDEFRTRQVLINLVSNATKFTRQGTVTIDVYTVNEPETGRLMIRVDVTDTGIGIADKDLPLLFEAFRQVDSSLTRTQGGTGLGLPIAKSLVEMQGGEMLVQSQVNVGSTFSILVPTEPVVDAPDKPGDMARKSTGRLAKTAPLSPTGALQAIVDETQERPNVGGDDTAFPPTPTRPPMMEKRQILLIEDNPDMVDQFRRALQREGFDIFAASIPLEAEAMASGLHPTIIIMDVNFADGQGWQMLKRMKSRDDTRDIPVVVVTINPDKEDILAEGAFLYVARPFVPEQIVEAVRLAEEEARIDKILIIDDQPESVRVLEDLLNEQGRYKVFAAPSAMDGISMVARRRPNLVILDLRMPEMDGFQVISELRSNPETATIPIIVVTGDVLNPAERDQLTNLSVLYKADINAGQRRQFMDGVKQHLTRTNGEHS